MPLNNIKEIRNNVGRLLLPYKPVILGDYEKYHNHVCRVLANCILLDKNPENFEKYAIAAVFHDIGIWTDNTIDYLDPSMAVAEIHLKMHHLQGLIDEIRLMIYWHHKTTMYKGKFRETVNTFRKADWMDVSLGILTFEAERKLVSFYQKQFPNSGFHLFLLRKIFINLGHHPLHPLPMFKR